jgi:N-acetylmuramoyl-L-alanine amidase CwlA
MSNSPLINETILDPNYYNLRKDRSGKQYRISKITIHHAASVKGTARGNALYLRDKNNKGSANYFIGWQGEIVLGVPEEHAAWTSSNMINDLQAVTIEVCNEKGAPNWEISDVSMARLIDLCVDICRRNGLPGLTWTGDRNGTLTTHDMFTSTICPGPYLKSKMPWIAEEVTRRVKELNGNPSSDIQKPTEPVAEKPLPPQSTNSGNKYVVAKYKENGHEKGKALLVTARSGLNCRRGAGKQYDIITTFPKNTKVMWYGYYNKDANGIRWLLVKGPGTTGYCMENFLK